MNKPSSQFGHELDRWVFRRKISTPSSTKQELKVVLDTNVWISALLWGGKPAEIIKAAEQGRISILISEEIVSEISQVLTYPKIKNVYQTAGLQREDLIENVVKIGKFVKASKKVNIVNNHPPDNKFLECAQATTANYLVSGDRHLLNVIAYKTTQMTTVNKFLELIKSQK